MHVWALGLSCDPAASGPFQVDFDFVLVCSSLRRSEILRRGWQTVEVPRWVVRSYSWSASQVGELAQGRARRFSSSTNQIAAQVVSPGATVPHRQFPPVATRGAPRKRLLQAARACVDCQGIRSHWLKSFLARNLRCFCAR